MNEKAYKTLEYDKIIARLAEHATSLPGKEVCKKLTPGTSLSEISRMQDETATALGRIFQKGNVSFGSTYDIRASVKRLEIGSALGIHELLSVCKLLENAALAKNYGRFDRDDEAPDILTPLFSALEPLAGNAAEIRRCIISEDAIADDASSTLRSIRRNIRLSGDRIHTELTKIISSSAKDYLQDSLITTRDGRYCIPVKAEYRNQVQGIVHDQSKTGSTFFIEPAAVVRLNNEIRELKIKEQQEIEVILARLSSELGEHTQLLMRDYHTLVELDFIFARAKLAVEHNATKPILGDDGILEIRRARHPLISKKKVVPIDIRLGEDFDLLVITGPNTGGKTVSLKTAGLLTMMALSGLHIPAADRSRVSIFREVYADIGDEQSIEQSLSTFSSHMKNVVEFLDKADENSLVLFDELGAGTDPTEGAALAIAILNSLHERGIRTIATTHYSEIKIYALKTPGVENASCEFNVDTLSPTYRLLIGVPGKSNAFAISRKLGLNEYVIDAARELLTDQDESFEDVISDLERQRSTLEKERLEAEAARKEINRLRADLEKEKKALADKKSHLISDSSQEAKRILQEAKDYADRTISYYAKHGGKESARELEKRREKLRGKMNALDKNIPGVTQEEKKQGTLKAEDLKIGDSVKVLSLGLKGTVETLPDARGSLFVMLGIMRTKVKLTDLEKIDEVEISAPNFKRSSSGKIRMAKSSSVSTEINLLGKTVDEAVAELDKYLDDAAIAHLTQVRIVHGKGTGALRKGVQTYLRKNKHVAEFRLGEFGEGDAGVTIAKLKG